MLYLNKGQENTLYLNINNNSRTDFNSYVLEFTHVMSKIIKVYTVYTNNPAQYFSNSRYCTITLNLATDDLNYEGQYVLNIFGHAGNDVQQVFNG